MHSIQPTVSREANDLIVESPVPIKRDQKPGLQEPKNRHQIALYGPLLQSYMVASWIAGRRRDIIQPNQLNRGNRWRWWVMDGWTPSECVPYEFLWNKSDWASCANDMAAAKTVVVGLNFSDTVCNRTWLAIGLAWMHMDCVQSKHLDISFHRVRLTSRFPDIFWTTSDPIIWIWVLVDCDGLSGCLGTVLEAYKPKSWNWIPFGMMSKLGGSETLCRRANQSPWHLLPSGVIGTMNGLTPSAWRESQWAQHCILSGLMSTLFIWKHPEGVRSNSHGTFRIGFHWHCEGLQPYI